MRRFYDSKNRCCSVCGKLSDKEAFKYHTDAECFMIEMANIKLKEEIDNFKPDANNERR